MSSSSSFGAASGDVVLAPLSPDRRIPSRSNNNNNNNNRHHIHHRRQNSASSQHSTGGLHSQHQQEHVYFDDSDIPIPPYLRVDLDDSAAESSLRRPTSAPGAKHDIHAYWNKEEADSAAGNNNVVQRVSSFNLLSRVTSNPKLLNLASPRLDATTVADPNSNSTNNVSMYDRNGRRLAEEDDDDATAATESSSPIQQPSWRLRDRMKTAGVGLIMSLNIGTDPPDIIKPHPCAKLQCWMDPSSVTRVKAKEKIGERLEAQYARWQQQRSARPLKYRRALDPTVEDVRALCLWLRRQARQERVLLHYNGHGVPRPTSNGEIWVFDKNHTEYIPLSVSDLRQWAGSPTICILDCSSAGVLIPFLTAAPVDTAPNTPVTLSPSHGSIGGVSASQQQRNARSPPITDMDTAANLWVQDMMVLCPTSDQEYLPMDPDYPADIFTSCLTTPIQVALRWFVRNNRASMGDLDPDIVDDIPGQANDRKTPLGELNWIFTAITDSIAWNVLPKPLFQRLFRQDLLVASMFRNFFLADRILRSMKCTPQSYPPLPPGVADHPLWYAWDLACETCLFGLIKEGTLSTIRTIPKAGTKDIGGGGSEGPMPNRHESARQTEVSQSQSLSSPFFTEQLTAFEVWLEYASFHRGNTEHLEPPEQLPIVLQVLLSQIHRVRALDLLRRFLELGPWAVNLSLSLGIFPYVMKLLQSPEYKTVLVSIWASILKFDPSCQVDLVKDNALGHFVQPLANWSSNNNQHPQIPLAEAAKQRILASFSLAATCYKYSAGQKDGLRQNLHIACNNLLLAQIKLQEKQREQIKQEIENRRASSDAFRFELLSPLAREWVCLCLGNLVKAYPPSQADAYNANAHISLITIQRDDEVPHVRAAATYALGCLLEMHPHPTMTSTSPSTSLSGEGGVTGQNSAPPSVAMGTPSPISLGPQALGNNPSSQLEGLGQGASIAQPRPQMFLPQATPITNLNPSSVSANLNSRAIIGNLPISASAQQITGAAVQQQMLSVGQNASTRPEMAGRQSLQPGPVQQQIFPVAGAHFSHHQIANMSAYQGVYGLTESNVRNHGIFQSGQAGMPPTQQAIAFPQRYPNQSGVVAMGGVMTGGHINMIAHASQKYPIGMPLIGSPLGGTQAIPGRQMVGSGSPDKMPNHLPQPRRRPTVFEDRRRVEFDMKVMESLTKTLSDGSPVVRYEVIMALSCFVEKYLQAFLVVAEDGSRPLDIDSGKNQQHRFKSTEENTRVVPLPRGINQMIMERFERCWKALREVQHRDPHPKVAEASSTIVRVVHETLLDMRVEKDASETRKGQPKGLSEIREEGEDGIERAASDIHLSGLSTPDSKPPPRSDGPVTSLPNVKLHPLRRSASEATGGNFPFSEGGSSSPLPSLPLQSPIARVKAEKLLPKSSYYSWKRSVFRTDYDADEFGATVLSDPLNPLGAARSYRQRKYSQAKKDRRRLAERYLDLVPRVPAPKKGLDALLDDNTEEDDDRHESLKNELRIKETGLLRSDFGAKMTSMLRFHSFESALVSCDSEDSVTVWDFEKGQSRSVFSNGNKSGSRMTTSFWINEATSGLFFVGSDDGSARIWKGIFEMNGNVAATAPKMSSAFFAIPEMEPGTRGSSGLICEWQQATGTLIAGGSSKNLHCWDLEAEKCALMIDSETDACITALTTAWDEENELGSTASRGMGPEVIVAGHSNGNLKVYDIRMPKVAASLENRRTRRKPMNSTFTGHGSWIVDACFTSYAGKGEIVSGSVAGDVRAWDLRMTTSSRAILAQRSPMTALAVHKRIPMIATGSHAQFIKILTLEGEALQVVRFHEAMPGHRIGPVSCLEFHKGKHILAAGSTNSLVNIYKPRHIR